MPGMIQLMPIRLDAEAIGQGCGAKARCTFDVDLLMSRTINNLAGEWKRCGR